MKNAFTKNVKSCLNSVANRSLLLMMALCMVAGFTAKADIINPSVSTIHGYVPSGASEIIVEVYFESNTMEFADFIGFDVVANSTDFSLSHGTTNSPSPYVDCALDRGNETTASGIGWMTPGFLGGGSGCGAFRSGEVHRFPLVVTDNSGGSGSYEILVTINGDGNGEANPSSVLESIFVQAIECEIVCPTDILAQAGANGLATVNVPTITPTGTCNTVIPDYSADYPIGSTSIEVVANLNPRVSCSFNIIVEDNISPQIFGCDNITETLDGGECGAVINPVLSIVDNSSEIPFTMTQNNGSNVDGGVSCPGGITRVFRAFNTDDYNIDTELDISSVDFGVLESVGGPQVNVTIYTVDGSFPGGALTEVATASRFVADGSEFIQTVDIDATIDAGQIFVVELSTQGSLFSGLTIGTNFDGETGDSYLQSDFCSYALGTYASAGFPGQAVIMTLTATEAATKLRQTDNTGYALGDEFPIGNYTLEFEAIDASGNTAECDFSVEVNGIANPIGSITCNDVVNVSLDEDCVAVVTPDQILEGEGYACYDDYTVEIKNVATGISYGNTITSSNIGMTLEVTVTGPNGNSCWGNIVIEDKGPAELICQDVYTTCTGGTEPGDAISDMVTFEADINQDIDENNVGSYTFDVPVFGLVGSTIADVNVVVNINHTSVSDLVGTVSAPDGTTVQLFSNPGGLCDGDGLRITLDDEAMMTAADLNNVCEATIPSIQGAFKSIGSLSQFDGGDPNGTWQITISDTGAGDGGTIEGLSIVFTQTGGSVVFPTDNATTFTRTGANQFRVNGIDACGPVTAVYADNAVDQPCTSQYSQIISRSWFVEDEQGNVSSPCIQNIFVFRNNLSTLSFPPNYDGIQNPTLSCSAYGDIIPDSTVTGYPSGDFCDNVQIFPYKDQIIDVCPRSYKIIRQWKLLEWCSGDVIEHNQIIKVEDAEGPELTCPANEVTSAEAFDCFANYVATKPTVDSECSDNVTYELSYVLPGFDGQPDLSGPFVTTNVTSTFNGQFVVTQLPLGTSRLQWRVFDECGNFSECTYDVTVEDQVAPVAVCDEFTTVAIGSDGQALVDAHSFDDLSLDNCGIVEYTARRMDNPECAGFDGTPFAEKVPFYCCDVNTTVMVEFRVRDAAGNTNSCMVEVTVQDKLPPYITKCPEDITLDCQADYEDLTVTGEPEFIDNCEVVAVSKSDVVDLDQCGRGLIRRTWTVEDGQGFKASCVQFITLADSDPFDISDIRWPSNYEANTCNTNLDPENLPSGRDFPTLNDDICSLTAIDYTDQVFTFVDGSCEKILRNWSVIDWCTYDPNSSAPTGYYTYTQIIKLVNTEAPEMVEPCEFIDVCSYGACGGDVTLTKTATDDCTPADQLYWTWVIDRGADGIPDVGFSGTGNTVNVNLPDGLHEIIWNVEDKCGNTSICKQSFRVKDCKKPTPYCRSSVTTVVMPSTGMIAIWANDFNFGSTDNCTEQENLRYSFTSNVNNTSRTFSCSDIPDGVSMFIPLEMWVTDDAGNQDYCEVALILQDNTGDICGEMTAFTVTGSVTLTDASPLISANIKLQGPSPEQSKFTTTDNVGAYTFPGVLDNVNYNITAEKNDDVSRGVSTLDLVLIQRHILTISEFDDPYKIIAADIDNNERVSGADIVGLRKLILGITDEFPNGQQSWRFVDGQSTMNVDNVFPYDETIDLSNMNGNMSNQDLVAVKIGDVNGSVVLGLNGDQTSENRAAKSMTIMMESTSATAGERVELPVYAKDIETLLGYQFTMNYDATALQFAGYENGQVDLTDENFGFIENGLVTTSWYSLEALDIDEDEVLFTLEFDVINDVNMSEALQISSQLTAAEAYDGDQEIYKVVLSSRADDLDIFSVEQNTPNPFADKTVINFNLPSDDNVSIEVRDLSGKLLLNETLSLTKGTHNYTFDNNTLNANGVLLYTLSTETATVTKRMVAIR